MKTDMPTCPKCGRINYTDVVVQYTTNEPFGEGTGSIRNVTAKRTCKRCGSEIYY